MNWVSKYVRNRRRYLAFAVISQCVVFLFYFLFGKGLADSAIPGSTLKVILAASIPFVSLGILLRIVFKPVDIPFTLLLVLGTPLLFSGPSAYILVIASLCIVCGYFFARYVNNRSRLVWFSITGALLQILVITTFWYLFFGDQGVERVFFSSFSLLVASPGFLGILLFIGEEVFSITTELKLLDLCNDSHPLLKTLRSSAPGTFYHSVNAAFIAEEGAIAIGADSLLCRAGGLYHDIGKMWKPEYYSENQFESVNVHEHINRDISRLIIVSHIDEGLVLARKHGLGKKIEEMVKRHHGNSPLYYYDDRIRKESDRYPGPLPSTREEGIVMLTDSIEATARSLGEITERELRRVVRFVIERALKDGQLETAQLSERDLRLLEEAFTRSLHIIYHNRIFYPSKDGLPLRRADDEGLFAKRDEEHEGPDRGDKKDGEGGPGDVKYH